MNPIQQELVEKTNQLLTGLERGIEWVEHNLDREEGKRVALRLKEGHSLARDLAAIAPNKPTVGVYGPSQVGKSYLMSHLFRSPEGRFYLEFRDPPPQFQNYFENGAYLDYIRWVNPTGGKESSGVVTRFTLPDSPFRGEAPIPVKFLNQVELAIILIDTFTLDITDSVVKGRKSPKELLQRIGELKQRQLPAPTDGLTEDDLLYFKNYLATYLEQNPTYQQLQEGGLWPEVVEVVPRLPARDRVQFFSLFWGEVPVFNQLFLRLSELLERLGFQREGQVGLEALLPKSVTVEGETLKSSIIDVGTLENLFRDRPVRLIKIYLPDGRVVEGEIGEVTGIVREVTLPVDHRLREDPLRKGFQQVDVYDFPGARVRKRYILEQFQQLSSISDQRASTENENILHEAFTRGKVNFLFNYYAYVNDITTLYLALKAGNQEVNTLPRQIDQWILSNYGDSPKDRAGKPVNLMISFHFFNLELDGKPSLVPGKGDISQYNELWETRFREHIEKWLALQTGRPSDNWIENWANGKPFQNFYFLRDPDYGKMTRIVDGKEEFTTPLYKIQNEEMRKSFITTPIVRKYIPDPERVWELVATPGHTGVELILEGIFKVTTWERRREQILGRVSRIAGEAHRELAPFYRSEDLEEERRRVLEETNRLLKELVTEVLGERNGFGELLYLLSMKESTPYTTLYYIQNPLFRFKEGEDGLEGELEKGVEVQNRIEIDLGRFAKVLGLEGVQPTSTDQEPIAEETRQFVTRVVEEWQRRVEEEAPRKLEEIGLSQSGFQSLLQTLRDALHRVEVPKVIADQVDPFIRRFVENEQNIYLISRLTLLHFNRFIESVGWEYLPVEQRPKVEGVPIFQQWDPDYKVTPPTVEELQLDREFPGEEYSLHWLVGYKEAVVANLKWKGGNWIENPEANRQLGEILNQLRKLQ